MWASSVALDIAISSFMSTYLSEAPVTKVDAPPHPGVTTRECDFKMAFNYFLSFRDVGLMNLYTTKDLIGCS
ncbi:hypothetical protein AVEN_23498-1 [Araneus ventricosus]|uniref:Uncharacterized protein n=1 Tax=Araneus ventricosus TaxID=182803 RepID=A0A4Y2S3R3_ARAVE|nr:hypothetical protein AVEN_23498-1 [Araneus ventricosus]